MLKGLHNFFFCSHCCAQIPKQCIFNIFNMLWFVPCSIVATHLQNNGWEKSERRRLSAIFRSHRFFPKRADRGGSLRFPFKKSPGFVEVRHLVFHWRKRESLSLLEKTLLSCDLGNYENGTSCEVLTRCCPWTKSWCNHIYNLILQAKSWNPKHVVGSCHLTTITWWLW